MENVAAKPSKKAIIPTSIPQTLKTAKKSSEFASHSPGIAKATGTSIIKANEIKTNKPVKKFLYRLL